MVVKSSLSGIPGSVPLSHVHIAIKRRVQITWKGLPQDAGICRVLRGALMQSIHTPGSAAALRSASACSPCPSACPCSLPPWSSTCRCPRVLSGAGPQARPAVSARCEMRPRQSALSWRVLSHCADLAPDLPGHHALLARSHACRKTPGCLSISRGCCPHKAQVMQTLCPIHKEDFLHGCRLPDRT